jgi:aminopeptidase N
MSQPSRPVATGLALLLAGVVGGCSFDAEPDRAPAPAVVGPAVVGPAVAGSAGIGDRYYPRDGNGGFDVTHYDVHDSYAFDTRVLSGRTDVSATARATLSSFHLDLVLPVDEVTVDGRAAAFAKPSRHELVVTPRVPVPAGDRFVVRVRYHGRPGSVSYGGDRPWVAEPDEATALGEPHVAPWWFAANDHPRDKATFDVVLRVPEGRQAISGGDLVDRVTRDGWTSWHWRMARPMAPYLAFAAVGRFRIETGSRHGRPWLNAVSRWYNAGLQDSALAMLRRTPETVEWLEGELGPYPFSSTGGVVASIYRGFALENQGRPTYPYLGTGDEARTTMVHELAHQWFGDSVSVRRWRDIWLNEGLASWAEWRWAETHGGEAAQHRLRREHAARPAARAFWRLRIADPGAGHEFDPPVYVRGAMAAQALRHRIGAAVFTRLLRTWVAERQFGTGRVEQFEALAERVSGRRLGGFFDTWLHRPGRPARTTANGF